MSASGSINSSVCSVWYSKRKMCVLVKKDSESFKDFFHYSFLLSSILTDSVRCHSCARERKSVCPVDASKLLHHHYYHLVSIFLLNHHLSLLQKENSYSKVFSRLPFPVIVPSPTNILPSLTTWSDQVVSLAQEWRVTRKCDF